MAIKPFAFVLMPFDAEFDDIYKLGIQAVATETGIVAERVDEQTYSESILERIYRQIEVCDFVVADMTGRNPNVFYEVGYAHARDKLVTLLTQSASDIPFDLRHHRHIIYEGSIQTLKSKLKTEFEWLLQERDRKSSSAITIELKSVSGEIDKKEWRADAKVDFVFDLFNKTDRKSPEIEAIYFQTGSNWTFTQEGVSCHSTDIDGDAGKVRHFIKPPVSRISPGAWAPVRLVGIKQVWNKFKGEEYKDKYTLSGNAYVEIYTSEGNFTEQLPISVEVEEFPF